LTAINERANNCFQTISNRTSRKEFNEDSLRLGHSELKQSIKLTAFFQKKTDAKTIRCLIPKMVASSKVLLYQPIQFIHKMCWSTLRQKNKNIPSCKRCKARFSFKKIIMKIISI